MKNLIFRLLPLSLCLLPGCTTPAAPQTASPPASSPAFPPTDPKFLSLPEKGPLPVNATVAGLPVTLRGSSVIVSAGDNDDLAHVDLQKNALTPFTTLLHTYPQARTVELSWFEPILLDANGVDVLYDRVKHTVTVDWSDGGGMDPQFGGTVRFTHVREAVFAAILKAHSKGVPENAPASDKLIDDHDNNAGAWGGFQYLYQARYGCRFHVVQAEHELK